MIDKSLSKTQVLEFPLLDKPWKANSNSIWLATSLQLYRNVDKFHFPSRLDAERKTHIIQLIVQALKSFSGCPNLSVLPASDLSPLQREYLLEHFLVFDPAPQPHLGEVFLVDATDHHLFMVNVDDHLHFFSLNTTQDPERTWKEMIAIEERLQKNVQFAFSETFGYLTSNPLLAGTGLVVSGFMHVPAMELLGKSNSIFDKLREEGVLVNSLQGAFDTLLGDIAVLKNRYTIGVTEEIIISTLHKAALHLSLQEKVFREELKNLRPEDALDKVSRALGILQHSFSLGTTEALKSLSLVKLGVELGWIQGVDISTINELFFQCRRAHLAHITQKSISIDQFHKVRAEYLRNKAQGLSFV